MPDKSRDVKRAERPTWVGPWPDTVTITSVPGLPGAALRAVLGRAFAARKPSMARPVSGLGHAGLEGRPVARHGTARVWVMDAMHDPGQWMWKHEP